jgi:uncharacterized membrane protein YgcG
MGLFKWLKRRKNRNTMHTTYVSRRTYEELATNAAPQTYARNEPLAKADRRAESTVRHTPDAAIWSPTYRTDSTPSSGCSDSGSSGSSSSSSDSGSSSGCDSGGS